MRYKIQIGVPELSAAAIFISGLLSILYYHLIIANGRFVIKMGVVTVWASLITIVLLTVFVFSFLKRRSR